jgi:DNA topoisomerase-1
LFQYIDDDGNRHGIDSGDVNEYLRVVSGREITPRIFAPGPGPILRSSRFMN